jgi:sugar fermentation stimulation protein A
MVETDDGARVMAHLANTGRLNGLLAPGLPCRLREAAGTARITHWDLVETGGPGEAAIVDAQMVNHLLGEALSAGLIVPLKPTDELLAEPRIGQGRFDFLLKRADDTELIIEAKSATARDCGVARFPDAPTRRGARHMKELAEALSDRVACAVMLVAGAEGVGRVALDEAVDPEFVEAARRARSAGVDFRAFAVMFEDNNYRLGGNLPIVF